MKFSHALIMACSLAFFACGGDDDSPTSAKSGFDCTVSDGVKVAYPTVSEQFQIGQTIDVVLVRPLMMVIVSYSRRILAMLALICSMNPMI